MKFSVFNMLKCFIENEFLLVVHSFFFFKLMQINLLRKDDFFELSLIIPNWLALFRFVFPRLRKTLAPDWLNGRRLT